MTAHVAQSEWAPVVTCDLQQQRFAASLLDDDALLRTRSPDEEAELLASSTSQTPTRGLRTAAIKKPWYAMKKDEKAYLTKEIVRLDNIKRTLQASAATRAVSLLTLQQKNDQLRQAIWKNQMRHARVQSAISDHVKTLRLPFEKTIRLGSSQADRVATFTELKHRALDDAERYLNVRLQCLDPRQEHSHSSSFTASNGDHCYSGFDVLPLDGFTSVQQFFEALRTFYFNMEITWTESSSELMLREGDYESGDQDVAIQRFVRSTPSGTQIESNTVLVSRFREGGREGDSAVLVVDFVDEDDLFPYRSSERLRQDITAVLTIKTYPKKPGLLGSSSDCQIVLTRAFFGHLHTSGEQEIPFDVVQSVTGGANFWFKMMIKTVSELARSS